MKKFIIILANSLLIFTSSTIAHGIGGANAVSSPFKANDKQAQVTKTSHDPESVQARYEGGIFGFSKKQKGIINLDDSNKRLVFRNQENKEIFSLPYKSLLVIYPDSRSYRSTGNKIASAMPLPGAGLLGLIRSKHRYLIVQFDDPDSSVKGTASFKLKDKRLLESVINSIGEKAELKRRGDAYYRARTDSAQT